MQSGRNLAAHRAAASLRFTGRILRVHVSQRLELAILFVVEHTLSRARGFGFTEVPIQPDDQLSGPLSVRGIEDGSPLARIRLEIIQLVEAGYRSVDQLQIAE
jgi:hypothetical protein